MPKIVGIVLIVVGLIGLAMGGFSYTKQEKILDIGPIHATREKTESVPIPPILGVVALIAGVIILTHWRGRTV